MIQDTYSYDPKYYRYDYEPRYRYSNEFNRYLSSYPYSSRSYSEKTTIPPEENYVLKSANIKIKYIALNIISLGLWNYYQKKKFQATLLNNDISKAKEIFSKCIIKGIGENFVQDLLKKHHTEALSFVSNLAGTAKISHFIFGKLSCPKDMDGYLSHLRPFEAICVVKSLFKQKDLEKFTEVFFKYGLTLSDIERHVEEQSYELSKATDRNLKLLQFYLNLGINPDTGSLIGSIIDQLSSSLSPYFIKPDEKEKFEIAKQMIKLLLEKKADPNKYYDSFLFGHQFPLDMIIDKCSKDCPLGFEIGELLLNHGADPNKTDNPDNWTIFENALFKSDNAKLISMMYDKGGRTSPKILNRVFEAMVHPNSGELERDIAIAEKLQLLKNYGGKISQSKCTKAFNLAIKAQDRELAHFLRENGADTSKFDQFVEYVRS